MSASKETTQVRFARTIQEKGLAGPDTPALLMVSGGSDSTSLAYLAADLHRQGGLGQLAILHVNHNLRGEASDGDAEFVRSLAGALRIPLFMVQVDIPRLVQMTGDNMEAVARQERYQAANEALESLCLHVGAPLSEGRIFTAHTQDDRVENFYMRSIVGTGPGGFRSMRYRNGSIVRPCLDVSRDDLRAYLGMRELDSAEDESVVLVRDPQGNLWREDATNAHTDRFRAYVRHKIVPVAKERNPRLLDTLCRSMNLIADEDDMLEGMALDVQNRFVSWLSESSEPRYSEGCLLDPGMAIQPKPLVRRCITNVLQLMLGDEVRVESTSVQAVCQAYDGQAPVSGYTANIQGDLAVSANKRGVRIEPMSAFRARRKR